MGFNSRFKELIHNLNTHPRKNLKSLVSGTWWWRRRLSVKRRLIWNMTDAISETSVDLKPVCGDGGCLWNVGWFETWRTLSLKRQLIWNLFVETEAVSETSVDLKLLTRLLAREHSKRCKHWKPGMLRYSLHIQNDSVSKGNILGGDSIGHFEERSSFEHVSDCDECFSLSPFSEL